MAQDTYIPYTGKDRKAIDLTNSLYGGYGQTSAFGDVFNRAYESLNQPLHETRPENSRDEVYSQGTRSLAGAFADRYLEKTGKLPDADTIKSFVNQNLTKDFAKNFITGGVNADQITYNMVDPFIDNNDLLSQANKPGPEDEAKKLAASQDQIEKIYAPLQQNALEATKRQFDPVRARAVEEEAALGRLRSGVSAAPESAIGQVDAQQGNALSNVIGNILGQKATGTLDLSKFNDTLAAGERRAKEAKSQFGQELAFNKQAYGDQQDLANKQLSISEMIGRAQAKGKERDWLDYLNAGVGVVGTGAKLFGK